MTAAPQHSLARERALTPLFFLPLLFFVITACGTTAQSNKILFDDPRGTVSLHRMADQSIQASHPINLEPALIAKVLSGMHVQERQRTLQTMLGGPSSAVPVFSAEEIKFLAPRIAKALTTAGTGEAVTFLVYNPRQGTGRLELPVTETTAGSLYAYGLSLYVTLSQYRYAPNQTNTDDLARRRLPDSSGFSNRTLLFTPSAAQRPDSFHRATGETSAGRFLAIDYQLLQQTSPAAATEQSVPQMEQSAPTHEPRAEATPPTAPSHASEALAQREAEIHTLKDLVIKKDLELETLRKELQSVRKQLGNQKRKTTPQQK
ncbi:MAG: hypothetical protein RL042_469 [Nitrospirota bacterium]|jgi:hypothetical protein